MAMELKSERDRPDIFVVLTTQWRAQATGYAGDPNACTPFLDELAERSLDLFQAVTPHPFGVFARAAFLTGVPCPDNGVVDYFDPLPENAMTIAKRFSDIGYQTGFFGKWQLFERDPEAPVVGEPHARIRVPETRRGGFDYWEGFESGFLLNDPYLHGTVIDDPTKFEGYQADVLVQRCCRWLENRENESPVFVVLSLDSPHPPYSAIASGVKALDPDSLILDDNVPEQLGVSDAAREELSGYYAHIQATDTAIGKLIGFLKREHSWNNSIFVFTSAHGDMHGAEGNFRKGWPHEESIRVPMLLSWPATFREARRDPLLFSLIDLGPTLLGLIGEKGAESIDCERYGRDLSKTLLLQEEGPKEQIVSMPSVAPFEKQCPYVWSGRRTALETKVDPAAGPPFSLSRLSDRRTQSG